MPHLSASRFTAVFSFQAVVLTGIAAALTLTLTVSAYAVPCAVHPSAGPSEAERAYLSEDYDHAASLYKEQLSKSPNDPALTLGMTRVLLGQRKFKEADELVQSALLANPKSAPLKTAQGEVEFREGKPWLVSATIDAALEVDPCYAPAHLLAARLYHLTSFYASAINELKIAHSLDPNDSLIHLEWIDTQPLQKRITELDSYIAAGTGEQKNLHKYLDYLKDLQKEPRKPCTLTSTATSTSIPFTPIYGRAAEIETYGLDVKLNKHSVHLQIDTGAGGILITRDVATKAGLKLTNKHESGGIGDEGFKTTYSGYVDQIRIGGLEFHDCEVEVLDKDRDDSAEGLIGMDVFAHFLVTLDYPVHKLLLGPLPVRPGDTSNAAPTLESANSLSNVEDDTALAISTGPQQSAPPAPHNRYVAPEMQGWTAVYRNGHDLMLPVSMNDHDPKLLIVDTGAFSTTIDVDAAREVTKVRDETRVMVTGISGKVKKVYTADQILFRFANQSQTVYDVVTFDHHLSKYSGVDVVGLLGIVALQQMTTTIDYRDGLIKFVYDPKRVGTILPPP